MQNQISCTIAQQSTNTPTIYGVAYHQAIINVQLNKHANTGIVGLLDNAALLAVAETYGLHIDKVSESFLQSCIESTSVTLSQTMTALSFALNDIVNNQQTKGSLEPYITPQLVADFAMLVGELLPFFYHLSDNLNYSIAPE